MGILNVTPDSFYAPSRISGDEAVKARVRQIRDEGASMIDVGACSTRPGSQPASEGEEMERLSRSLPLVRRERRFFVRPARTDRGRRLRRLGNTLTPTWMAPPLPAHCTTTASPRTSR
jgi:dihydropteroate synthase